MGMKFYKKVNLLILDEWLLTSLREIEARDGLENVEVRLQVASTIFCSQFETQGWYEKIGEATLADTILDRIIHDSYKSVSSVSEIWQDYPQESLSERLREWIFQK